MTNNVLLVFSGHRNQVMALPGAPSMVSAIFLYIDTGHLKPTTPETILKQTRPRTTIPRLSQIHMLVLL